MDNSDLVQETVDVEKTIADLAARYTAAGNFGVQVLNVLYWPAESLIDRLPENALAKLVTATVRGL